MDRFDDDGQTTLPDLAKQLRNRPALGWRARNRFPSQLLRRGLPVRIIGDIRPTGFRITTNLDTTTVGPFARWYDCTMKREGSSTLLSVEIIRNRVWQLPGIIFMTAGALGLVSLVWSLLWPGAGDPLPIQWVLALAVLPFGLLWWSTGSWLANQLDSDKSLRWLEEALDLEPLDG